MAICAAAVAVLGCKKDATFVEPIPEYAAIHWLNAVPDTGQQDMRGALHHSPRREHWVLRSADARHGAGQAGRRDQLEEPAPHHEREEGALVLPAAAAPPRPPP